MLTRRRHTLPFAAGVVCMMMMTLILGCSSVATAALQPPLYDYPSTTLYPNTDAITEFEGYFTRVVDDGVVDDDSNPYWIDGNWVFDQFDLQFDKFSELRVQTYLQLLSDATGFPVTQIVPVNNIAGKRGLEYGSKTLFSVQLLGARPRRSNATEVTTTTTTTTPPTTPDPNTTTTTDTTTPATPPTFAPPPGFTTTTPPTTTTTPAPTVPGEIFYLPSDASIFVNAVRASLTNTRSPLTLETAFTIRRVYPTFRRFETAETGVNYYWVVFILLSVIMVGLSIFLVFHYRSTSENPSELEDDDQDEERGLAEQEMMEFDDAIARREELDSKVRKSKMAKIRDAMENEQPVPLTYEDVRNKEWEAYLQEESRNAMLYGGGDNGDLDDDDDTGRRAIQEAFNDGAFTSVSRAIDEAKQEVAAHPYIYGNMASLDDDGLGAGNEAEEKQKEARRQAEALVEEEERQRVEKLPFVQTILHDKSFALPLADEEAKVKMQRKKRAALIKAARAAAALRAGRAVTDDADQELDEAGKAALADMTDPEDNEDVKVGKRIRRERRRRADAEVKGYQGYVQLSKTELFDITKAQTIFQANVERGGFKTPIVKRLVDLGIMHYDPVLDTYEVIPEEDRNDPFKQLSSYVPPHLRKKGTEPNAPNEIEALNHAPTNLEEYAPRAFGKPPPTTTTSPGPTTSSYTPPPPQTTRATRNDDAAAASSPVGRNGDDYSDPSQHHHGASAALSSDSNPLDLSPDNDDLDYRSQTTGGGGHDVGGGVGVDISDASLDLDTDAEDEHIDFGAKEAYVSTSSEEGSEVFEL